MQVQLDLLDDAPPLARRTDPVTSHQAAESAAELQARQHRVILSALKQFGPSSKDRIAVLTRLTGVQVCRRLPELERRQLAIPTGETAPSVSGRAERIWRLV